MNIWIFSFMYFPEDKSAYFPAAIEFAIFAILCVLVFRWIVRKSRKQEEQTRELEERLLNERKAEEDKEPK